MERQLIKVAKELNVGMETVVRFLTEKGFEVENKPIAKISDDMYGTLVKKFSDSMAEKQKADQIVIGTRPVPRTPNTPLSPLHPVERKPVNIFPPKEVPVQQENSQEKVPEVIERQKIVLQPIVGKIDLSPKKEEPKPKIELAPKVETPKVETPKIEQAPRIEATPKVEDRKPVNTTAPVQHPPKQEGKPQHQQNNNRPQNNQQGGNRNNNNNNNRNDRDNRNNNNRDNRNNGQRNENRIPHKPFVPYVPPAPELPDRASIDHDAVVDGGEDLIRAKGEQLKGLNIKGKIDIVKFLEREKEFGKSGAKKKTDRDRDRRRGGGGGANPNGGNRTNENKVAGATGTGTNIGTPRTEGGANNPNSEANKRKRKRKKAPTTGTTTNPAGTGGGQGGVNRPNDNRTGGGQGGFNRSNDNRTSGGTGGGGVNRPNDARRTEPTAVSQQQIEAKIKETMARLNIGGKNKGQKIRRDKREKNREREEQRQIAAAENVKLQVAEFISVSDLASVMDIAPTQIITTCMGLGIFVSINQRLDAELIEVITSEFGHEVEFISAEEQVGSALIDEPDAPEDLLDRAPIVTIMGHVDHGKTSLLDHVRKANVASGEAGGITQHIGAYEVKMPDGRKITFLDTPGHEAFTAMRARGAKVTDVAVVIIAADDSIMPQTREAISHAQAAGVPIVFAINKIDKPGADPERIKNELAQMNLLVEAWGGKFQSQDISAKQGLGVDELLEKILLEAEVLELKANPNKRAIGTIVEASLDKGRGYVSKMLVQAGSMKIGDPIVAGEYAGKIKAMFNERGKKVLVAGPSTPVLVLGLSGAPQAGETFKVMPNESEAKEIATRRAQIVREQSARSMKRMSLEEIGRRLALGTFKELNLIIKGDMDGSVEALADSLLKQSHETVQVNVIHKAVGAISESDVMLASASDAIIIGFQVRPSLNARKLAEKEGVEIKMYSIIYEAIQEIRSAIEGMLEPTKEEKILGTVEIREVYKISKIGTVAGCYVQEGKIERKNHIRIIRDGIVIFPVKEGQKGALGSLKRFKDDAKEVKFGFECGLTVDNYNDMEPGDFIEAYEIIEVKQKLEVQR
jgi:translation initiation factor IF-2